MSRIGILGAGAWGTALAISLARRGGHKITLWSYLPGLAQEMRDTGVNKPFLPGYVVPMDVEVTADLPASVFEADIVLCVTPSEHMRSVFGQIAPLADARPDCGERDQGAGRAEPAAHVAGDCIADGESLWCAQRAVVCRRSRGWDSNRDCGGVRCAGCGADHPTRVQLVHAAALHERRCGGRGAGRRAEECDCVGRRAWCMGSTWDTTPARR